MNMVRAPVRPPAIDAVLVGAGPQGLETIRQLGSRPPVGIRTGTRCADLPPEGLARERWWAVFGESVAEETDGDEIRWG